MSIPTPIEIAQGIVSWDALINKNFQMLVEEPAPIYNTTSYASLPSASTYEECLALVVEADKRYFVFSDGTTWNRVQTASSVDPTTAVDLPTAITLTNDLITSLKDGGLMNV